MKNRLAMGLAATIMVASNAMLQPVMAAPSTNSNSSSNTSNTSGTTSTAKPPKPNPAQALLDNLADKLERDLTE
ncbi:MAG TPA: hypothetical protein VGB77_09955, partial [Abditibacteriaceae bacterium]